MSSNRTSLKICLLKANLMASLIYKLIKWKPWSIRSNYDAKGECQSCPQCGHGIFKAKVMDRVGGTECEVDHICTHCGEVVNFWAYGQFDPCYKFSDRSWAMFIERMQYRIRGLSQP
jgi:ribosomal protein S27AE